MSNIESIGQDTKHELEEKAHKENIDVEVLEVTIVDQKGPNDDNYIFSQIFKAKNEVKWHMVLLGLRIAAFVFCLISFSVLGANEQSVLVKETITNWFLSGFDVQTPYRFFWYNYNEFKYSFSANVIGFVYSGLQICLLVRYLITKKHIINPKLQGYFNVAIDQTMAYILMSASSSAATAAHLFESYLIEHGAHKFKEMANASIVMSFFAFVAFALASLVSCFILTRFT